MTETENPTPNPDFEAAVQEKLRQENPVPPDQGTQGASEYIDAKTKFGELYPKWVAMSNEEQESENGVQLAGELQSLHVIISKYEPQLPPTEALEVEEIPVSEDVPATTEEEEAGKDVQAQHQNILTPEHYLGSEKVNPDNPMLEHMNPEDYYANANKENR